MLYSALMFLVVGLIAGALNLAGVSTVAVQISWILFLIGTPGRDPCVHGAHRAGCVTEESRSTRQFSGVMT